MIAFFQISGISSFSRFALNIFCRILIDSSSPALSISTLMLSDLGALSFFICDIAFLISLSSIGGTSSLPAMLILSATECWYCISSTLVVLEYNTR